ncbi:unnamed protein product [Rhodiola kirilowii]
MAAGGVWATGFNGSKGSSIMGEDCFTMTATKSREMQQLMVNKARPFRPMMKNVNEGKGIFAPAVVVVRNVVGKKEFNQLRGKAIAVHSQVINEFCKSIGADSKQRQGLIRLAKKNGEKLGFLA